MIKLIKKYSHIIFFVIVCLALSLALFACDPDDNKTSATYTVKFVADSVEVARFSGKEGDAINIPSAPPKEGYDFGGWYDDAEFGEGATTAESSIPARDVTYFAKYVKQPQYTVKYYLQKLNADETAVTDEYELYDTVTGTGSVGSTIVVSESLASDVNFGFERVTNAGEDLSLTISADESKNVLEVKYDRLTFKVKFDANGGEGEMAELSYPYGAKVQNNFQNAFTKAGHRFAWFEGKYDASGDPVPTTAFNILGNVTFTAQWHRGYASATEGGETVYFDGNGFYILSDGGTLRANSGRGDQLGRQYYEFEFTGDVAFKARLYDDAETYVVCGEEEGNYILYDYVDQTYKTDILSLDGFGFAVGLESDGVGAQVKFAGTYQYNADYHDFEMTFVNTETFAPLEGIEYFVLHDHKPQEAGENISGSFNFVGLESGEYAEYLLMSSELGDRKLQLFGEGTARVLAYDPENEEFDDIIAEGIYKGTENHSDYFGEWEFLPTSGEGFRFLINYIDAGDDIAYIFIEYDARLDGEFDEANGGGGKLRLGGYNAATYTAGGTTNEMSGAIDVLGENTLRFTPYQQGQAQPSITFDIDRDKKTFALNTTGLVIENGVLKGYFGTAEIIEVPDGVTEIADEALDYKKTGVSLTHVRIPASVIKIGARAFENEYSLETVVFDSADPIEIDWSAENDPFRWPSEGAFKIYVPNGAIEAYKAAWSGCEYTITSVEAETDKPEFEVDENGVLLSYNNKDEAPHDVAIELPEDVLYVADGVFAHITYIVSADLKNATKIGESAFEGCDGLASLKADKLQEIGARAFSLCTALESVSLPAVTYIGEEAFSGDVELLKASLGANIERIDDMAFAQCGLDKYPELFTLEFASGSNIPIIGDKAFNLEGYRVSVATVDDALELYESSAKGWTNYAGRATVRENEQSAIAGEWIDITTLLTVTVGGRLETTYTAYIFRLEGEALTLYVYNGDGTYEAIDGAYKGGRISFEDGGANYAFAKREGELSYASNAGETLVIDLDSYNVEEIADSEGFAPTRRITVGATFVGQKSVITVTGSRLTMSNVKIDGVNCNVEFALTDGGFSYTKTQNDKHGPYKAADGSEIYVVFYEKSSVCLTGSIAYFPHTMNSPVTTYGTWNVTEKTQSNVYVAQYRYRETYCLITVKLDETNKTFTYTVDEYAKQIALSGEGSEKVIVLLDKDGKTVLNLSLMLAYEDGTDTLYVRSFTLREDGSYLVEAEQWITTYDEASGQYVRTRGALSGVYEVTLDIDSLTCAIKYAGELPE